jgi:hypothetical protein
MQTDAIMRELIFFINPVRMIAEDGGFRMMAAESRAIVAPVLAGTA